MKPLIIRNHQEVIRGVEIEIIKENRANNKKLYNIPKGISRKKNQWRGSNKAIIYD